MFTAFSLFKYFPIKPPENVFFPIFVTMKTSWNGLLSYLKFLIKRNPE